MKLWTNIASVAPHVTKPEMVRLLTSALEVEVFSTKARRVIGRALRYEIREDLRSCDLWAECEIEDNAPPFARAAAVIVLRPAGLVLVGIIATDFSREELRDLAGLRDSN